MKQKKVSSYDEQVEIEFFDGVKTKSDNPTTTILLFSKLNTLKSLTEVNDKVTKLEEKKKVSAIITSNPKI